MMKAYFELYQEDQDNLKFDIYQDEDTGRYYVDQIEPPCNDRRPICTSDSFLEAIDFIINKF